MAPYQISASRDAILLFFRLVMFFLSSIFAPWHFFVAIGFAYERGRHRTGFPPPEHHDLPRVVVHGYEVAPHLLALLVLYGICAIDGRVDEL